MEPRVYSAPRKGMAYFAFNYDPVYLQVARTIPSHRKWDPQMKVWEFKLSRPALEHIRRHIPNVLFDQEVHDFLEGKKEQAQQAITAKSQATGITHNDIRDYKFKTIPFDHQAEAFMRSRDLPAFALFMEQGTGKTKVAIDNAAYLFANGKIDALLVVCPNSVKTNWVRDELEAHMPDWVEYDAAYWEATNVTKVERAAMESLFLPNGKLKILVTNVEGLSTKRASAYAINFCKRHRPMLVIDESSRIKRTGAKRSAACRALAKHCPYRRIMTGTPVTQGPLDLFSQFLALDENILGYTSYYAFRNHFAVMGGYENKQVIGYQNIHELHAAIEPYSYRVLKQDCLDLPDKIYQKLYVQHSPEQARTYKAMRRNMIADLQDGQVSTSKLAITTLNKLQQINSNFIMNDLGEVSVVDAESNPRLDALVELLEQHGGKAIIWARYNYDIEAITARLNKEFGDGKAAAFYGKVTSTDERTKIRSDFQSTESDLDFFVGNPAAGGIGLTLTQASLVVYYSNDFSLESRLQSEDRAHRIGQTKNVTYVDFVVEKTVDEKIVKALREKRDVASLVTKDNLKEWI